MDFFVWGGNVHAGGVGGHLGWRTRRVGVVSSQTRYFMLYEILTYRTVLIEIVGSARYPRIVSSTILMVPNLVLTLVGKREGFYPGRVVSK